MGAVRGSRKKDDGFVSKSESDVGRKASTSVAKSLFESMDTADARNAASTASAAAETRVTKRELKKQVDDAIDDRNDPGDINDDDQDKPKAAVAAVFQSPKVKRESTADTASTFGSQSTTPVTPSSLHDDFINLMKAQGLERMATDAGLLKDGQFRDLKREWGESINTSSTTSSSSPFMNEVHGASTPKKKKPRSTSTTPVSDKGSKGLRHFSMKVCQKVEEKHVTTYNEVADELVHEFVTMRPAESVNYDEKNIRRRVYDALNVLMAMDIISKEKKEIRWRGLPSNAKQDLELLQVK
ncbi:hypothetical protein, variant [Aphanomyces astaci]|uniref:E2F/DP family winged-helix DNA-binding domain-containing protein n=1 Tax=Aphanomyces astaci TaxID=112090 RepID=W4FNQ0_APHAT|nr:hypothetical protein, variant [Aphanomyces astaci]ETV68551.1 hypothetical protein, variant [Aphanomyces astaci]|eukprot:XP_009841980.1 hypothetical protein, variant [Aphanomyces astaci]